MAEQPDEDHPLYLPAGTAIRLSDFLCVAMMKPSEDGTTDWDLDLYMRAGFTDQRKAARALRHLADDLDARAELQEIIDGSDT
jgi:hypothetical protein